MKKLNQIRNPLKEELGKIVEFGAEGSKATLEVAIALGWLGSALTPVAQPIAAGLAFVGLTKKGLELYRSKRKQELDLEEWVAIAFPLAYIESFDALVQKNEWLRKKIGAGASGQEIKQQFDDELGEVELTPERSQEALKDFPNSWLGYAMNGQLSLYLKQIGLEQHIIPIVTGWVAWRTRAQIESLLPYEESKNTDIAKKVKPHITASQEIGTTQKFSSIEYYLQEQISPNPIDPLRLDKWKVFDEPFKIPDIYVPLKAQLLDSNGRVKKDTKVVDLETWAKDQLTNFSQHEQVMFIQAGPGRGKSVFCRMFADWVREHLHPIWTPILIRLRDIDAFEPNIENTFRAAIKEDFAKSNDGWLTDRNTRFLFILDGFDELRFEGRTAKGIETFLQQVGNYQTGCRHRFLVTGRESALQGIEHLVPTNLERVEIVLMDDQLQEQWLNKWGNLVGQDKAKEFQEFLKAYNCPYRVQELAREPLLLYLLAAMHRDNKLTLQMFKEASGTRAKILIYQTTMDWVLTKQRPEKLNLNITEFETEDLRRILTEAGLCVTQSGKEWTSIKIIEERLKDDKAVKEMLEKAQQRLSGDNPLRNALAAFYLRPAKDPQAKEGAVEFIHKSFGEFLCAQRLAESLEKWGQVNPYSKRNFFINDSQMAEEIYDLLSYGGLTREIVDYLMALLDASVQFEPVKLFKRLEDFYLDWYKGKFINDENPNNLPLNQMQSLWKQEIKLGLREVDIYVGLNVMILLLELHRYAQSRDELKDKIVFNICGQKDSEDFEPKRLSCIINYSNSVSLSTFLRTIGSFLSGANLESAYLVGANLEGAYLAGANLESANLEGANLEGAILYDANLSGTNLAYVKGTSK
ncbi:pentapeptide repeat protein (plasmid) [Kalymmatonema gypsitolerans NIES-4073]|nr:pentapeptide repeat protein [Scytonema sp. NIES-4073]